MAIIRAGDVSEHRVHGSTFRSFVAPGRGGRELCAWELTVPAATVGAAHRPSHEEVLLLLEGSVTVTIDARPADAGGPVSGVVGPGDVVVVPAGASFRVDGGEGEARLWVTTTPGLEAVLDDGTSFRPLWAN